MKDFMKNNDVTIKDGGWHFSYMGGLMAVQHKLRQYAHTEYSSDNFTNLTRLENIIRTNGDLFNRGDRFYGEDPKVCLPDYILNNLSRYQVLIFPVDKRYLSDVRVKKFISNITWRIRSLLPPCIKATYFLLLKLYGFAMKRK